MGIDTSPEMNDLARTILMQGKPGLPLPAGYFFKMHLPMSNEVRLQPMQWSVHTPLTQTYLIRLAAYLLHS